MTDERVGFVNDYLYRHILPAAYGVLPTRMQSLAASAMLLAIALQESGAIHRKQVNGPARGFWQFERAGVTGVRQHRASRVHLQFALSALCYHKDLPTVSAHTAIEHNDVLACVFARLLLWTDSQPLPDPDQADDGWHIYLRTWRPGKPHPETWPRHFAAAWELVSAQDS